MSFMERLGTFKLTNFEYTPPEWEALLDLTSDYTLEKSGYSRKQIEELLTFLTEEGIVK